MRRQDNIRAEFPLLRWSAASGLIALALGYLLGPPGLKLLEPRVIEDSGIIEGFGEVAVLTSLFCVGLRLRAPLEWQPWRMPVRLSVLTMLATVTLAAAAAHILFDMSLVEALLLGAILAPTDAVLASDIHAHAAADPDQEVPFTLAAEGAISSGLAITLVLLVLTIMGVSDAGSVVFGSLTLTAVWSVAGGVAAGWLIGAVMARWIGLLDADRQGDFLEEMIVFATAALAYCCALAMRTDGLIAVFASGLALAHGGRLRRSLRKYALGPRVMRLAGRVERFVTALVMVLLGALVAGVDLRLRMVLFALVLLIFVRPFAVRLGLGGLAVPPGQRRLLEWFGARAAASLYCLALAVNHGLSAAFARQLAGVTLVVIVASIVFSAVSAVSLRRATPGAVV